MPYEPVSKTRRYLTFSDLPIGIKFFFHYDLDRYGKGTVHVKVADDSYIQGTSEGVVLRQFFLGLVTISSSTSQYWNSPVERCGMMSEDEYRDVTARYR